MMIINDLIQEADITLSDIERRNLTYIIEKMELDFNQDEEVEDFGLHSMYLDEDEDINLVCLDGMQQHGTYIKPEELNQLSTECTIDQLNTITERVKVDMTQ